MKFQTFTNKNLRTNYKYDPKRSKSVAYKQKVNSTLSVVGVNGTNSPYSSNFSNAFIGDFHKTDGIRFKILKETMNFLKQCKTVNNKFCDVSPYKLHSDIMSLILNRRKTGSDDFTNGISTLSPKEQTISNKYYCIKKLYDEIENSYTTQDASESPLKQKRLNIVLNFGKDDDKMNQETMENQDLCVDLDNKIPNSNAHNHGKELLENIKKSIYTDSLYDSAQENDNQTQLIEDISVSVDNIDHRHININSMTNKAKHNRTINSTVTRKQKEINKIELGINKGYQSKVL